MEIEDRVLNVLRENGRESYSGIAQRAGITPAVARATVRRLQSSGEVRIAAVENPELGRKEYRAHVSIWAVKLVEPVLDVLKGMPQAHFISTIGGLFSVIAELHAGTRRELQEALTQIRGTPGVEAVSTVIYDRVFRFASLPVPVLDADLSIDAIDEALIALLQEDGRLTYRELGERVNLTSGAVFARVRRLFDDGLIKIGALVKRGAASRNVAMGVGLNVYGDPETTAQAIARLTSIEFVATGIGRFDIIATVSSRSLAELRAQLDSVHSRPEVASLETWVHLEILREVQ
ncbi:Lrp/AsnC family transcriptional regulator [Leucobacter sp. L43]|uniref:Lrp/AsnC family transcriptional regulator n=1 Tax=Leucobacter sp. L43 TaxID=2798040 RepID=UPI0019049432|nr:Lrp/AsnC family transcriptional regulator [Leucobacter sp. L43]